MCGLGHVYSVFLYIYKLQWMWRFGNSGWMMIIIMMMMMMIMMMIMMIIMIMLMIKWLTQRKNWARMNNCISPLNPFQLSSAVNLIARGPYFMLIVNLRLSPNCQATSQIDAHKIDFLLLKMLQWQTNYFLSSDNNLSCDALYGCVWVQIHLCDSPMTQTNCGPSRWGLWCHNFKISEIVNKNKWQWNAYSAMYRYKILCEICKVLFEISHKIRKICILRCVKKLRVMIS